MANHTGPWQRRLKPKPWILAELVNSDSGLSSSSSVAEAAAARRRAELSSSWPTAEQVGQLATELRKSGQLLGVCVTEPHHDYRFPIWQFQRDGQPVFHFAEILNILREHGIYLNNDLRTTGWGEVEWFLTPHVLLNGESPAEVLQQDPQAVLEAARMEFIEDNNSGGF